MYYFINLNKQSNSSGGNYEIHEQNCHYCNALNSNFHYLGYCSSEYEALLKAKRMFSHISKNIDGCFFCCKKIHKG